MCERAWERWWTEALAGAAREPALLLVEGAAGMGKSRLVHRLLTVTQARALPRLVVAFRPSGGLVVAEPAPAEADAPAGADRATGERPAPGPPAGAGHGPAAAGAPPPAAHPAARCSRPRQPAHRVLESALAAVRPAVLVAEDVHHADGPARALLRGLLAEPPGRFAAVLTYRPERLARPGLPLERAVDYPARLSVTRCRLAPLTEPAVRTLAGEVLGAERCPQEFVARLARRTGGTPQVLVDLLRMLRDSGAYRAQFTARDVDEAGVPARLAEAVLDKLAALPAPYRPVVWAAAVLGEDAAASDLAAVAGLCAETGHAALVAALENAALRENGEGRYGFAVPLAARVVYAELPGPVRERLHRRAAALLAGRKPVPWARIARHWRAGGRTEDWLRAAERVAADGGDAGARAAGGEDGAEDEAAVALLEQTLAVDDVPPRTRGRLALTLARGAMLGLRSEETARVLRRIVDDPTLPAPVRGEIRLELGLLLHNRKRRFAEGRTELRRAAAELAGRPALAATAMAALANPFFPGPPLAENLGWLARAERAAAASRDDVARLAVAACRATVLMNIGDPEAWRLVAALPRDSTDRAGRQQVARGLCNTASGAVYLGHHRRAEALLTEGVALAARSGAPFLERVGRGTALFRDWLTGRWEGLADRCTGLVAEDGSAGDARVVLALLALAKGEWDAAGNWLPHGGTSAGGGRNDGHPARGDDRDEIRGARGVRGDDQGGRIGQSGEPGSPDDGHGEAAARSGRAGAAGEADGVLPARLPRAAGTGDRAVRPADGTAAPSGGRAAAAQAAGAREPARAGTPAFAALPAASSFPGVPACSSYDSCEAPVAATAAGARIRLLFARGHTEAAAEAALSAWGWLGRKGVWVWGSELAPWAVQALTGAGRTREAAELVAGFAGGLDGRDAPSAAAALLWCRALLAEADGDPAEAQARFREASAAYAALPHPYARALTEEGAGRCAFALGSGGEAAARRLTECVERLTALGAAWDAARVRAMLRAHRPGTERRRPGRPAYGERMSPRESEVAGLAATGLTNREIAATLHLSPRTVEQHIARAMRKLGVNSRQVLADRVAHARTTGSDGDAPALTG
ncbi:LuxR C-terminal-related transcriptional regulator [Streptomyces sp. JJ36]|uniref:helix-turn-helix transcriptional regulator n=1 Tax=Streptomyces sp. JJ36 TaxID=2736645 RepID=UPI0027E50A12|nr:LuxR C-terminal-related transcriptional regulator [Streptomyces sp. JJ36]MCF6521653.1 AAA family ATPase [Streptomyces sp. JJ36]